VTLRAFLPEVAFSPESSNHLWHSQFNCLNSDSDSKSNKMFCAAVLRYGLLGLLGFIESLELIGFVEGVLCDDRDVVKPSESKTLNTLNVSIRFDRLKPVKTVMGDWLDIENVFIGSNGFIELLGFVELFEKLKKVISPFVPNRKGR